MPTRVARTRCDLVSPTLHVEEGRAVRCHLVVVGDRVLDGGPRFGLILWWRCHGYVLAAIDRRRDRRVEKAFTRSARSSPMQVVVNGPIHRSGIGAINPGQSAPNCVAMRSARSILRLAPAASDGVNSKSPSSMGSSRTRPLYSSMAQVSPSMEPTCRRTMPVERSNQNVWSTPIGYSSGRPRRSPLLSRAGERRQDRPPISALVGSSKSNVPSKRLGRSKRPPANDESSSGVGSSCSLNRSSGPVHRVIPLHTSMRPADSTRHFVGGSAHTSKWFSASAVDPVGPGNREAISRSLANRSIARHARSWWRHSQSRAWSLLMPRGASSISSSRSPRADTTQAYDRARRASSASCLNPA